MNSLLGEETNDFGEFSRLSGMLFVSDKYTSQESISMLDDQQEN